MRPWGKPHSQFRCLCFISFGILASPDASAEAKVFFSLNILYTVLEGGMKMIPKDWVHILGAGTHEKIVFTFKYKMVKVSFLLHGKQIWWILQQFRSQVSHSLGSKIGLSRPDELSTFYKGKMFLQFRMWRTFTSLIDSWVTLTRQLAKESEIPPRDPAFSMKLRKQLLFPPPNVLSHMVSQFWGESWHIN